MNDVEPDWKKERIYALKQSLTFFSNRSKFEREKWVARRLVSGLGVGFHDEEFKESDEPVDVAFRDARFQIKEVLNEGRKRSKEFKDKLEVANTAKEYSDLLEHYSPVDVSFTEIVTRCSEYARNIVNNYGPLERQGIDLVCYFNYVDYHEVPPVEIGGEIDSYRSFSVISNRYCAVISASHKASQFLIENKGRVVTLY